jgi:hypothetical protein
MFIAKIAQTKDLAPLGAKPGMGMIAAADMSDGAPTERNSKERTLVYKHLAPMGRKQPNLSGTADV